MTLVFEVVCCVPTHDFWAKNGGDLLVTVGLLFRNHAVGAKLGFCDSTLVLASHVFCVER